MDWIGRDGDFGFGRATTALDKTAPGHDMISAFASYGVEWDTTTAERRRRRGIYLEGWRRGFMGTCISGPDGLMACLSI